MCATEGSQMAKTPEETAPQPEPPGDDRSNVTVRMFCQGLGDCFLITMPNSQQGERPYSILIDCGVAQGTADQKRIMETVVGKIADLTHNVVDLLVVTHEHLDHVSGFAQAEQVFDKIEFRNVWLAWTENGRDKLAQELKKTYGKAKKALSRVRAKLAAGSGDAQLRRRRLAALDGVLAFYGKGGAIASAAAKARAREGDLERAMANLKRWGDHLKDKEGRQFLKPGQSLKLPDAPSSSIAGGTLAHVFGPPHDRNKIGRINPRKRAPETYEKKKHPSATTGVNWSWSSALMGQADGGDPVDPQDADDFDRSQPFDRQWRIPLTDAAAWRDETGVAFFGERYFAAGPENDGRRIDEDWLWSGAQRLALHIENYTNNTSLVLAFELPRSGKVLLFAADAQVGNWLSWHDQPYTPVAGESVTAESLLGRTVLYKVGHHGSHNATLRELGLELMNHPELTAMLPVEAEAVERLGYGEMPVTSLMTALNERCDGRILQLDRNYTGSPHADDWKNLIRAVVSKEEIRVGKVKKGTRPLYIEYTIRD